MSDSFADTFLVAVVIILFVINAVILIMFFSSYNLPHSSWKCAEEIQVGEDITNHECITYKKRESK